MDDKHKQNIISGGGIVGVLYVLFLIMGETMIQTNQSANLIWIVIILVALLPFLGKKK